MSETLEYIISVRGGGEGAAQVRKVEAAVSAAGGTMTRFGGATEKAAKKSGGFTSGLKGMLVQLGLVAGAYKAVSAAKGAVAYTKTLAEGSAALDKATGLGIQRSSQMLTVAEALDIPVGALTTGFRTLSKDAVKQAEDTGKSITAFDRLGISTHFVKEHQHDFNAILDKSIERLTQMPKGIRKNNIEVELFGKSFAKLNPLIGNGVDNLHHLLGIANKYGAELKGSDATKQLEELREAQVESRLASDGLKISFTKLAGPSMVGLLKSFAQLKNDLRTNNMGDFGKQVGKVADVAEKAFVIFEEHAIEGMGQTGPKLAKALWHGFTSASTQNQGLMIGAMLLKFGVAGKAFGFVGGHLGDLFIGSFRKRAVKGAAETAAKSAAAVGAEDAAFGAAGSGLGLAFGTAFGVAALGYLAGTALSKLLPNGIFGANGPAGSASPEQVTKAVAGVDPNSKAFRVEGGELKPNRGAAHTRVEGKAAPTTPKGDAFRERIRHRNEAIEHRHPKAHGSSTEIRDIHVHVDGRKLFTINARQALEAQAAGE